MNKRKFLLIFILMILLIFIIAVGGKVLFSEDDGNFNVKPLGQEEIEESKHQVSVVPTMKDTIEENSAWCATFQLVWNDMQDNLVEGDIEFSEPNVLVDNLNSQIFKENDISKEYYYKKCGLMTLDLKEEIERGIEKKFGEKSDILDMFDWEDRGERYFFYAMLKRDFEFLNEFEILDKANFKDTENVEYFGIESSENDSLRNQVSVLYYNTEKDFAVKLHTKSNDEIILAIKDDGGNFEELYSDIIEKSEKFDGNTEFGKLDILKVPNIDMNVLREYQELAGKPFAIKDGTLVEIEKAVQTIQMKLDNKGGSIRSEAAIAATKSAIVFDTAEPRNFSFDKDFVIFLKEADKKIPYFAASISDINLFVQK
ncbi:MAG: hypothetical protein IJW20_00215 [Clostridia bacterium]|nr:hypothetical protein [Clostridia bacterium]